MKRHSYLWGLFVLGGGLLLLAHALGMGNSYGVVPILGSFLLLAFSFCRNGLCYICRGDVIFLWFREIGKAVLEK